MSEADQFLQYAEEAMLWVAQSKTEREKGILVELARTWIEAAAVSDAANGYRAAPLLAIVPQRRATSKTSMKGLFRMTWLHSGAASSNETKFRTLFRTSFPAPFAGCE